MNVGGTSTGTPVLLNFTVNWSGTYQYSSTGSVNGEIYQSQTISVNDNVLLGRTYTDGGLQKIEICTEAAGCGDPNPSPGIEFLNTPSGSGQVSYRASASYLVTTGSSIHFHWVFQNIVNFGAGVLSASDDFYDPAQLNITATDPSTGDAVTGVTLTGSDGTPYLGANKTKPPATVPEPSSLILMVSGLTAAGALRRRSVS